MLLDTIDQYCVLSIIQGKTKQKKIAMELDSLIHLADISLVLWQVNHHEYLSRMAVKNITY